MTIALDASYSLGSELSGIGVYSREILYGLASAHPEQKFDFWYRPHRLRDAWREHLPANARRRLLQEPLGPRFADLFHGLNQRLPRMRPRRAVATFHDLFVMTGDYSTPEFRRRFTEHARHAAGNADAVIAVSEFTATQVHDLLGVERSRIHAIPHGVRALEFPALPRENVILHVGAIQARKNIARLVRAFERVDADWRLVLAGSAGYGADEILRAIESSPARERILATGYVSAAELAAWYARARIFAFPSLDEGFGMPLLEAMAAGVPVLSSRRSALPEVCGDAGLLVNPQDSDEITDALVRLSRDEVLRSGLIERGRDRASRFRWSDAVEKTWVVYETVLTGAPRPRQF